MKRSLMFLLLALGAALPAVSQPLTVGPGNDAWRTGVNSSQIDLSAYPIASVFSATATVSPTVVPLSGVALDQANLGSTDTLLERFPPSVTFNFIGDVKVVPVEIKALRMRGQVTVTDGGVSTNYNLTVALSEVHPANPGGYTGTMTLTLGTPDGGRFNSEFPVVPKLVFREVGNPLNEVVLDCGVIPGCPADNRLRSFNNCWVVKGGPGGFDPATKGITPIRPGIAVDGTFDGVNDYTTVGRLRAGFVGKEFHVGFNPVPPFNPCGGGGGSLHEHANFSQNASKHVALPPTDCKQTTTGTTGTSTRKGGVKGTGGAAVIGVQKLCPDVAIEPVAN